MPKQVAVFNKTELALTELEERLKTLPDVSTTAGYKDCVTTLRWLRTARTSGTKERKKLTAGLRERITTINNMWNPIETRIVNLETPLKKIKKDVDDEKKRIKVEAAKAEEKRIQGIHDMLGEIHAFGANAYGVAPLIAALDQVNAINTEDGFDEFSYTAEAAKKSAIEKLEARLVMAKTVEMEALLAEERRKEQEEKEAILEEQRKALEEEQRAVHAQMEKARKEIEEAKKKLEAEEVERQERERKLKQEEDDLREQQENRARLVEEEKARTKRIKEKMEEAARLEAEEDAARIKRMAEERKHYAHDAKILVELMTPLADQHDLIQGVPMATERGNEVREELAFGLENLLNEIDSTDVLRSQADVEE